jgi:PTS system beta-glucosides-specific IIC component
VFTPIIPAIAGAGIFKSLLVLASAVGWMDPASDNFKLLSAIPDAVFAFLPLLVAYTTAKKLDVNRPLALGLVSVLMFPAFTALVSQEGGAALFGLAVPVVNYSAQVFPAILAVMLLAVVERFFNRVTWAPIRTFFVPLMCLIIVAPAMIFLLGPLGNFLGVLLTGAMIGLYNSFGWVAVMLLAGVLPLIISVGMHKAFIPPTIATLASSGRDTFYLVASLAHNLSEAGSSLAVALRTKNTALRATALSGGVSALFGITEPALYGVTLQNRRALIAVVAGSMSAGAYLGLTQVAAFAAVSPGVASFSMFIDALTPWNLINAAIGLVIAVAVSFIVCAIIWRDSASGTLRALGETAEVAEPVAGSAALISPLTGTIVPLSEVDDAVFSSGILGEGVAIRPTDGAVRAPIAGVVTALLDSKHAVGIRADDGVEVLVHVGIDTVQLNGSPFVAHVAVDDRVEVGQLLLEADLDAITAAGYDTTTPVLVVNSVDYTVTVTATGTVTSGDPLVSIEEKVKELADGAA